MNIEQGQVEIPHKPVKHLGVQVQLDGQTQGMVIANIGLEALIKHFEMNTQGETFLTLKIWPTVFMKRVCILRHTTYTLVWDRRSDMNSNLLTLLWLYGLLMIAAFAVLRFLIRGYFKVQDSLDETTQKLSDSEHQLMLQSKHAAMGEIMCANGEFKEDERKIISELFDVTNLMLDEQAKTIKDFQDYLNPNKEKEAFEVADVILAVEAIMETLLAKKSIVLTVDAQSTKLWGLPQLFSRYTTSKGHSDGTGLGLYITRMILEDQFLGEIHAQNTELGVLFKITMFPCAL